MHKKPAVSTATVSAAEAPPASVREGVKLMAGRWNPETRAAIQALIMERGRGAPAYDAKTPPVVKKDLCSRWSTFEIYRPIKASRVRNDLRRPRLTVPGRRV